MNTGSDNYSVPLPETQFLRKNSASSQTLRNAALWKKAPSAFIKTYYIWKTIALKLNALETALLKDPRAFFLEKSLGYPDTANSNAFYIGKARYKDHDETQAKIYEAKFGHSGKTIDFTKVSARIIGEIKQIIHQLQHILLKWNPRNIMQPAV